MPPQAAGDGHHVDPSTVIAAGVAAAASSHTVELGRKYTLQQLQASHRGDLSIDFAHKERYLSDEDFAKVCEEEGATLLVCVLLLQNVRPP